MTNAEHKYYKDRQLVRNFLNTNKMSAWDLARISKELCACGTCHYFTQHYTKDGEPLDWGHCTKGNIQHSKKVGTNSCGFWADGLEQEIDE